MERSVVPSGVVGDACNFDYTGFTVLAAPEREWLCARLRVYLTHRLARAENFYGEISRIIQDLRAQGHDLWNFDQDGERTSIWCPDWTSSETPRPGLILEFEAPASVSVTWQAAA